MDKLLVALQSNNNAERSAAERQFNDALKVDVRSAMNELLQAVLVGVNPALCCAGAVLFRGQLVKATGDEWWSKLSGAERNNLRAVLVDRLRGAPSAPLRRHVSQIVSQIARMSVDEQGADEWPQLLGELAAMSRLEGGSGAGESGDSPAAIAVATMGELVRTCPSKLEEGNTKAALQELMVSLMVSPPRGSNTVRASAVGATTAILTSLQDEEVPQYEPALKTLLGTLQHLVADEERLLSWFESVIEIISSEPRLVSTAASGLVTTMLQIAGQDGGREFSDDVRKQALEVCLAVIMELPLCVKEDAALIRATLQVCLMFMLDSADDVDEIEYGAIQDAAEEESLLDAGAHALYTACEVLGESRTLGVLFPMIEQLLSTAGGDWRRERAGLLALTRASYSGGKLMYAHLEAVLTRMLPFVVREDHVLKVRHQALDTLSAILLVFGDTSTLKGDEDEEEDDEEEDSENLPSVQQLFAEPLLKALSTVLSEPTANTNAQWGLKARAAMCVSHFCFSFDDGAGNDTIGPFAPEILNKIYRLIELSGSIQENQLRKFGVGFHKDMVEVSDLQCSALSAVGSMAKAMGEPFGQFYGTFMPIAQKVHQVQEHVVAAAGDTSAAGEAASKRQANKWTEKQVNLRGTALEAMGNMGMAVGKERFQPDAAALMTMIAGYMDHAWAQNDMDRNRQVAELASNICTTMGQVDNAVLGKLIPPFLRWAQVDACYQVDDEEAERLQEKQAAAEHGLELGGGDGDSDEDSDEEEHKQYIQTADGEYFLINTFLIKEKETAIRTLSELISALNDGVMPWAPQLADLMIKEITAEMWSTHELTLYSTFAITRLVESTSVFLKKQVAQGTATLEHRNFAQKLFEESVNACLKALMSSFTENVTEDESRLEEMAMGKEFDEDEDQNALIIIELAQHVSNILRAAFESGGRSDSDVDKFCAPGYRLEDFAPLFCLAPDQLPAAFRSLAEIIKMSCERPRGHPWWKEAHNNQVMDSLSEAVGLLMKTHGQAALPAFVAEVMPIGVGLLQAPMAGKQPKGAAGGKKGGKKKQKDLQVVSAPLKAVGLFFIDDALEFGRPDAAKMLPNAMPFLLEFAQASNFQLRQAALFGLGICAEHGGAQFQPYLEQVLAVLVKTVDQPGARKGNGASATENAVSALAKCILFRGQTAGIPKLLNCLPCDADVLEAKVVHYRMYRALADQLPAFQPFQQQVRQVLLQAYAIKQGYNDKTHEWDEDDSVLSRETREWVRANLHPPPLQWK